MVFDRDFFEKYFINEVPCSFCYEGKRIRSDFGELREAGQTQEKRQYERIFSRDEMTATLHIEVLTESGGIEWWLEFAAKGEYDSGLIEDVRFCHMAVAAPKMDQELQTEFPCLHWAKGSRAAETDFSMERESFWPFRNDPTIYSCDFGRSSSGCMPYFNLQTTGQSGVFLAIGWSGQWSMSVQRLASEQETPIEFQGFMDRTCFRVQAGEKLCLPHMLALPWKEMDIESSYNIFRRMLLGEAPKIDGRRILPPVCVSTWGGARADYHRMAIELLRECKVGADVYWMDAGWFGSGEETSKQEFRDNWYYNVGAWEPLMQLYPKGMEEIGERVEDSGMKFLLWFELERAVSRLPIVKEHREYFIGPKLPFDPAPSHEGARTPYSLMLNLGDEEARRYITEVLARYITDCHMSVLRIDFNYEPLTYWRYHDSQERWGITEIKYINGLYTMMDELRSRFPHLAIDNCASGGRRLDYQMFRRSIPLFVTDYLCAGDHKNEALQVQNFQVARWLPIHGAMCGSRTDTYSFRSHLAPGCGFDWGKDKKELRKKASWYAEMTAQAKRAREILMKDLYLLTEEGRSEKAWFAYEAFDKEREKGLVLAFRRKENIMPLQRFSLKGVDKDARYCLEDADSGTVRELSGQELMDGLEIEILETQGSALIFFERIIETTRNCDLENERKGVCD